MRSSRSGPSAVVDVVAARATTARIVELCDELQSLRAELAAELGGWLDTGRWALEGARSPAEWLGLFGRLDGGDARRLVRRAQLCQQLSSFSEAFAAGQLTAAHLDALARAIGERWPPVTAPSRSPW